jgi:hypothetical protein
VADIEECWDHIYTLWDELDLEYVLAAIWPVEKRWQIDALMQRIEAMDDTVTEIAFDEALALAELDDDNECVELLKHQKAHGDFSRERKVR